MGRADDPGRVLDHIVYEMKAQLAAANQQVAVAMADERMLRRRVEHQQQLAHGWEHRAMLAVRSGDDVLARQALSRKQEADRMYSELHGHWAGQKQAVDSLRAGLQALSNRIADAQRQKSLLVARAARAHAQHTIAQTLAGLRALDPYGTLEALEHRVTQYEAEAEALCDLGSMGDISLEAQFRALESVHVDDELADLKRRMALPPGR